MTKGYSGMEKFSESSRVLPSQVSSFISLTIMRTAIPAEEVLMLLGKSSHWRFTIRVNMKSLLSNVMTMMYPHTCASQLQASIPAPTKSPPDYCKTSLNYVRGICRLDAYANKKQHRTPKSLTNCKPFLIRSRRDASPSVSYSLVMRECVFSSLPTRSSISHM